MPETLPLVFVRRIWTASKRDDPLDVLLTGVQQSKFAHAFLGDQGELIGIVAVAPSEEEGIGCVWLLPSDDIAKYRMPLLRRSVHWLKTAHETYPTLFSVVDERNERHIEWLRGLDFEFIERFPDWGCGKRPFYSFARVRHV